VPVSFPAKQVAVLLGSNQNGRNPDAHRASLVKECLDGINAPRKAPREFETGHGDYTKDREQFLPEWTVDGLIQEADKLAPPEGPRGAR
jgi:hypothetical protein